MPVKYTTLADGTEIAVKTCQGYLQKIDISELEAEKEIIIVMCENILGELMGMGSLQYFSVIFNGIQQVFTIIEDTF